MGKSLLFRFLPIVVLAALVRGADASEPREGAPDPNGNRSGRPAAAPARLPLTGSAAASAARPRVTAGPLWSAAPTGAPASMAYPSPGNWDVDFWRAFSWTTVAGARSYQLLVGTAPGLGDVFDSGETPRTSLTLPLLPAGSYHGRIATNFEGRWSARDFTFGSTGYPAATLRSPSNGSVVGVGDNVFSWDPFPNASAYRLVVGTAYGESNVADSGAITATSFALPWIPQGAFLYARLFTLKWETWRASDAILSTGPSLLPVLVAPVDGATFVNTGIPFEWKTSAYASSYRLEIGTSPGGNDLHDSGEISVPKRFVGSLPIGRPLYGRLSARILGLSVPSDFAFTVGVNGGSELKVVSAALWATSFVRGMANDANFPYANTPLASLLAAEGWVSAFCTDYVTVLLTVLEQMNVTRPARQLNVCLKPNRYDCHSLLEFQEPIGGTWMLLDPTFDLTARRASDGLWATASDVSRATRSMNFSDVAYQFLGARGNSVAKAYYLDYPLLFLNVYRNGADMDPWGAASSLPYMVLVSPPVSAPGLYAVRGAPEDQMQVNVDGAETLVRADPIDGLSHVFWAASIDGEPGITVYRPRRFVF